MMNSLWFRLALPGTIRLGLLLLGIVLWGSQPSPFSVAGLRANYPAGPDETFFENKIRPVLVEHCQSCHSVKSGKSKGGLLLDSRKAIMAGGETGPVIDLKEPNKSRLLLAMSYEDPDLRMPPKGKLSETVRQDLRTWIEKGAIWPGEAGGVAGPTKESFDLLARKQAHWSWGPLKTVGDLKGNGDWIDRYLDVQRGAKGIKGAAPADPATQYRRLHLLLTGMGPSESQVKNFLANPSDEQYQATVDRLLDSWEFAEHWGRHWLDLVRYGETRGHEFDFPIPNAWQYRDYIVRALKADVSYRDLLREHLAGDLLKQPRLSGPNQVNESLLATGFFFLGEEVHSPVDIRQDESDRFDNRIDVLTKTFLGMTVACARCHDHKFDAISTKDYYALYSMLESASYRQARFEHGPANRALASQWNEKRIELEKALLAQAGKKLQQLAKEWPAKELPKNSLVGQWLEQGSLSVEAKPLANIRVDYRNGSGWFPDDVAFGPAPRSAGAVEPLGGRIGFLPLAAGCRDPFWEGLGSQDPGDKEPGALAYRGAGRTLKTDTFDLKSGTVWMWMRGQARIHAGVGAHVMILGPLHGELVMDSGPSDAFRWVRMGLNRYKDLPCHLEFTTEDPLFAVSVVVDQAEQPAQSPVPGLPKIQDKAARSKWLKETVSSWGEQLAKGKEIGQLEQPEIAAMVLSDFAKHTELGASLAQSGETAKWQQVKKSLGEGRKLVSQHAPAIWEGNEVTEKVFVRGSPKVLGTPVKPRNLEAIGGELQGSGSRRLELAEAWIDPQKSPMVPRVAVNRLWHHLFGKGIVQSVDNLGVLGDAIQNQELLDQLARDFVDNGWSIKKTLRRLVLTKAFRQSSQSDPDAVTIDPDNRLVHHFRPRRMSGETIRDNLLRVSGELSTVRFGPPTPPWVNAFQEGRGRPESGKINEDGRRSIYVGVRRNFLSQWMLAFDTPIPFSTVGRRSESHVPAQSLMLLNHPLVHFLVEKWATNLAKSNEAPVERIQKTWRNLFGRDPLAAEVQECLAFLQGENPTGWASDPNAWKMLVHGLVNTRDFVFIR